MINALHFFCPSFTNSKALMQHKGTLQSPHWHFNEYFIKATLFSILFHSAKHVQFSDSNVCWQFSNSSFSSPPLFFSECLQQQLFKFQFIMLATRTRVFVSRKCTACKVAMSDPLVIFDSRHSNSVLSVVCLQRGREKGRFL